MANDPGKEKAIRSFGLDITRQVSQNNDNYRNMNCKPIEKSAHESASNQTSIEVCCKSQEQRSPPKKAVNAGQESIVSSGDEDNKQEKKAVVIKTKMALYKWDLLIDESQDGFVMEYMYDVMNNLRNEEDVFCKEYNLDYMPVQKDISVEMRSIVLNWLTDVHRKFHLMPCSFFATVDLLDRFLSKAQVVRSKLQLIGCACLWIASKYHERYCPAIEDFTYISDNAFEEDDLVAMECNILKWVEFKITIPTPLTFAERSLMFLRRYLECRDERKVIGDLIMYCVEHLRMNYITSRNRPSFLVSVAFVFSCIGGKVFTLETYFEDHIDKELGYHLKDLLPCMERLRSFVSGECKVQKKLPSLVRKYCSSSLSRVASLDFTKFDISTIYEYVRKVTEKDLKESNNKENKENAITKK